MHSKSNNGMRMHARRKPHRLPALDLSSGKRIFEDACVGPGCEADEPLFFDFWGTGLT